MGPFHVQPILEGLHLLDYWRRPGWHIGVRWRLFQAGFDKVGDFLEGCKLVHADHMCLPMEMRRSVPLILSSTFESQNTAKDAPNWAHVTAKKILTSPIRINVTPRAVRAHSHTQQVGQAEADIESMCFYNGQWVPCRCQSTQVIFWQFNFYLFFFSSAWFPPREAFRIYVVDFFIFAL